MTVGKARATSTDIRFAPIIIIKGKLRTEATSDIAFEPYSTFVQKRVVPIYSNLGSIRILI